MANYAIFILVPNIYDNLDIKLSFHAIKMRSTGVSHKLCYKRLF
jgi:hypothetical protein